MKRIFFLASLVLVAILLLSHVGAAFAQSYPHKPIRCIVPYPPGGVVDFHARIIGQKLSESWGQQVVIDNRGGAGATLGTALAAKAAPDGYTFLVVSPSHAINATLYKKLTFHTEKDFAPVTQLTSAPLILVVHPSVPAKSTKELIVLAKSKPGQLNYASSGSGTSTHLAAVLFTTMAGVDIVHIPYKGGGPATTDLLAGHVQMNFAGITLLPHIKAGKLRALAVTTAKRSMAIPDLPTIAESGLPGYEVDAWYGAYFPAETPREIVSKLNKEIVKILHMADVKAHFASQGAEIVGNAPEEFAAFTKAEIDKWAKVVKDSGARVD